VTGPRFETFLAQLYADEQVLAQFLADPRGAAARSGLSEEETLALLAVDVGALQLAAEGFAHKRAQAPVRPRAWWRSWW